MMRFLAVASLLGSMAVVVSATVAKSEVFAAPAVGAALIAPLVETRPR